MPVAQRSCWYNHLQWGGTTIVKNNVAFSIEGATVESTEDEIINIIRPLQNRNVVMEGLRLVTLDEHMK